MTITTATSRRCWVFLLLLVKHTSAVTVDFNGDSWLNEDKPDQTNGDKETIKIKGGSTTDKYGWFKFVVSDLGLLSVVDAKLKIYNDDVNDKVNVYEADSSKTESTVTWNNHGGQSTVLGYETPSRTGWFEISLTASHFAANGAYAFVVKTDSSAFSKNFISDDGGQTPELILTVKAPPTRAPTTYGCDHVVSPGSLSNINMALDSAYTYDTICLEEGTYTMRGGTINMKKGITLRGLGFDPSGVILDNTKSDWVIMLYENDTQISNATFANLEFRNIGVEVGTDSPPLSVKGVTFDTVIFRLGLWQESTNCGKGDHYIHFEAMDGGRVIDSQLYREAPEGGNEYYGRGITDQDSNGIQIVNNIIGGSDATEALNTGYFVTAINCKGQNGVIDGNIIYRNAEWNDLSTTYLKDHGIYAVGFQDAKIENNVIGGWDVSAGGAGLKVRSGDGIKITGNIFHRSGIMLLVDGDSFSEAVFEGDSFLNEAKENQNYGSENTIKIKGGTSTDKYGWFKFNLQNFGTIKDAKLIINNEDVTSRVKVYEADSGRTELDVTWNNHGGRSNVLGQARPAPNCEGRIEGPLSIRLDESHFSGNGAYAFVVKTESSASGKNFISDNGGRRPSLLIDDGSSTKNDLNRVYVHNNVVNVDPNTPEPQQSAWGGGIGFEKFKEYGQTGILIDHNFVNDGRIAVFGEKNGVDATEFNDQFVLFGERYCGGVTNNVVTNSMMEDLYYIIPKTIRHTQKRI